MSVYLSAKAIASSRQSGEFLEFRIEDFDGCVEPTPIQIHLDQDVSVSRLQARLFVSGAPQRL